MKKKRFKIDKMPTREPDFRIRYNRWFKPPYTLIVWDVKNKKEYCTNHFDFDNCVIQMKYKNSIKQEKECGSKVILLVWKKRRRKQNETL
tara:strand:- start:272 stop:541 length:270 start_codon:yes stop_codon:yes gene_type:complete